EDGIRDDLVTGVQTCALPISAVLANIKFIDELKTQVYGLPAEPRLGGVLRSNDTDNGFVRIDHGFNPNEQLFVRYFVNDGRLLKIGRASCRERACCLGAGWSD